MKYSAAIAASMAVAVSAVQPAINNLTFNVTPDQPFNLQFTGCAQGCTITLLGGNDSNSLTAVKVLTSSASGGSFPVSLGSLPASKYAFKITDNVTGEFNYSQLFPYGTGAATTTAASSSAGYGASSSASGSATSAASSGSATGTATGSVTKSATGTSSAATGTTTAISTAANATTTKATSQAITSSVLTTVSIPGPTGANTTVTRATSTGFSTTATGSGKPTSTVTVPGSGAVRLGSPLALVAGAVAAMVYLC